MGRLVRGDVSNLADLDRLFATALPAWGANAANNPGVRRTTLHSSEIRPAERMTPSGFRAVAIVAERLLRFPRHRQRHA
jgi:hypothetical protein